MDEKNISKEDLLLEIDKKTNEMLNMGTKLVAISSNMEPFDIMFISIVNRTVNINSAFSSLIRNNNFIAAAPLIRINLDSVLRMYASKLTEFDRNTFTRKVMDGEHVRKMKSEDTKKPLTDFYLVDEISKVDGMSWVKKIYDTGSSFVHFSDSLIFSSRTFSSDEERTIYYTIAINDAFVEEHEKIGAVVWMNKIIDAIINQCQIWMYEKCIKYNFDFKKLNEM